MQRRRIGLQRWSSRQSVSRVQPAGTQRAASQRYPMAHSPSATHSPVNVQRAPTQSNPMLQSASLEHSPVNTQRPLAQL